MKRKLVAALLLSLTVTLSPVSAQAEEPGSEDVSIAQDVAVDPGPAAPNDDDLAEVDAASPSESSTDDGENSGEGSVSVDGEAEQGAEAPVEPADGAGTPVGWSNERSDDGEAVVRYYRDGSWLTGLQSIDGKEYGFDESNGNLIVNKASVVDGQLLLFDSDGDRLIGSGWKQVDGNWYLLSGSIVSVGWAKSGGSWYYLDKEDGIMKSSEVFEADGKMYIAQGSGACPANKWVKLDSSWYYTDSSCALRSGWAKSGSTWYYLDPETHIMKSSELFVVGGKTYLADSSGACPANAWVKLDGSWYYTDGSCALRSGWAKSKGVWYYLDPETYIMKSNEAFLVKGVSYVANSSGACPASAWVKVGNDWYLTSSSCATRTGWAKVKSTWYYLDPNADDQGIVGKMLTGLLEVGGKRYYLKSSGAMAANEFVKLDDGIDYYADGSGVLGLYEIDGVFYRADGSVIHGWLKLGSKWYYLDQKTGKKQYGWIKDNGKWYWLDSSGAMVTGRKTVDGKVYLFASSGEMVKSGWQNPEGYPQVSSKTVVLPSYASGYHTYVTPSRISVDATRDQCIEAFIGRAYDYLGTPFKEPWAQAPGVGIDCSGLVLQCLYATGMDLEHAAGASKVGGYNPYNHYYVPAQTYNSMRWYENDTFKPVSKSSMRRGDLVFYDGHVAIYLGNGKIIHSTSATGNVCISDVNIWPVIGVQRPFV